MTEDEIIKVTKIMLTADGWCTNCNAALIEQLQQAFPAHKGIIDGIHQKEDYYHKKLDEAWDVWYDKPADAPQPNVWEITL